MSDEGTWKKIWVILTIKEVEIQWWPSGSANTPKSAARLPAGRPPTAGLSILQRGESQTDPDS